MSKTANSGIGAGSQHAESPATADDSSSHIQSHIQAGVQSDISTAIKSADDSAQEALGDHTNQMERSLTKRHVQFIAIGGTIGTVSYTHL